MHVIVSAIHSPRRPHLIPVLALRLEGSVVPSLAVVAAAAAAAASVAAVVARQGMLVSNHHRLRWT